MSLTAEIDLSENKIIQYETDPKILQSWLGGRGYAAYLLYNRVGPEVAPFAPENCLIFSTGRLNGTTWPAASRYHVTFKSPATGAYGYANSGGHFGPELSKAGYDALVITGRAKTPVLIQINGSSIQILPANHLWGLSTTATEEAILASGAGGRVACIGPAGENRVYYAAIINDGGRAAARSGPGAVMGSKNLKAIHVVAGNANRATSMDFKNIAKQQFQKLLTSRNTQGLMNESTLYLMQIKNKIGDLPTRNHQSGQVPFIHRLDTASFSRYWVNRKGCTACPIRCARTAQVSSGKFAAKIEGPEYESADSFGPLVWNADPEIVIRANELCNQMGLDTISTGVSIAFAMECHQRGLLDDPEFSLDWGDPESILGLIQRIADRSGIGELLASGTRHAAEKIGRNACDYAIQVKGVELPRQEPRVCKAFGLGHAVSNRGADHLYGLPTIDLAGHWEVAHKLFPEAILSRLMDVADETYKPEVLITGEHFSAIVDSLGLCKFSTAETYIVLPEDIAAGLTALGFPYSKQELLTAAERIVNLERLYNVRHHFSRKDDYLPKRFTTEPLEIYQYAPAAGENHAVRSEKPISVAEIHDFDAMLDHYYDLRGWSDAGIPTVDTLQRLAIADSISLAAVRAANG
ncbi:aldehyde:ferredoxin oxidoreductase [Longilinea arvoryzae]|uniref:Aldehyde:ferredoxin oxidoreductase n=1 Tax=Longilinea arvoryzae TaxID=360412 RepID=A0A0S7BJK1_9CHLR|nr:aldehyde ferredoxin oxidoreductase family protein [Longilinea arvoryzae]GAP13973.1 aldehyde:ferredoxin oxidoreductase [Longilinea arvoryzae]